MRPRRLVAALLLASSACRAEAPAGRTPPREVEGRVYLEEVAAGSPLARAGLRPGDSLASWARGDAAGTLTGFDDVWELEHEQAPRGPLVLAAERDGRRFEVSVPLDRWRVVARPALPPPEQELLGRARREIAARRSGEAAAALRELRAKTGSAATEVWASWRIASLTPSTADPDWTRALLASRRAADPGLEAWVAGEICTQQTRAGRFEDARGHCQRALGQRKALGQELAAAEMSYRLARLAGSRGDPREEERLSRDVLERLRAVAPRSLPVVRALHGLAKARATQDDREAAFRHGREALALAEELSPRGMDHQASLMVLGIFHWLAEEWAPAEARLAEALEILEAIDPDDADVANALNNLGIVAADRGDLSGAERYYRRSLEVRARVEPNPLQASRSLNNLANLAEIRGDYVSAARSHREVLELRQALAPDSLDVASPLLNLGRALLAQGALAEAERHLRRALAIQRRHAPGSRDVAMTLRELGEVELARNDAARAGTLLIEAHKVARAVVPDSLVEAEILVSLGEARARQGATGEAVQLLRRSAELCELLAPNTLQAAVSHHALGRYLRAAGRPREALTALRAAVGALDRQFSVLGGTDEVRVRFRESWRRIHRDLSELLLELQRKPEAFEVNERARAQAFLFMLRARELAPRAELPPALERDRRETEEAYAATRDRLAERLAAGDREAVASLLAARRELQHRRDRIVESARDRDPRLAELSRSLSVALAQDALGEENAALIYTVGERRSWLWALGPGRAFEVFELPVGDQELRSLVDRFRLLLESPSPAGRPERLGSRLYQLLVAPAEAVVGPAARLVIVPDGPLHHLPFAALAASPSLADGHLIARKPLRIAPSLSAWNELRRRPAVAAERLLALADPDPPSPAAVARRPGLSTRPPRLPRARWEGRRIASPFGRLGRLLVGAEASEAAAKRMGGGVRYLHFATHAYVDPISPLDSALLLAPGAGEGRGEDGLLEAWEVLQDVRLDADLVTLSACETGVGADAADEGLLGLTRAFHLAGARTVLASLWQVHDASAAALMDNFYLELRRGLPKDEALRRAQLALLRGPFPHPHHWAAFQLYGDGE